MHRQNLLLGDVAHLLGVKRYRITYALVNGLVPEPEERISNKRLFHYDDVERLAKYFGVELKEKK